MLSMTEIQLTAHAKLTLVRIAIARTEMEKVLFLQKAEIHVTRIFLQRLLHRHNLEIFAERAAQRILMIFQRRRQLVQINRILRASRIALRVKVRVEAFIVLGRRRVNLMKVGSVTVGIAQIFRVERVSLRHFAWSIFLAERLLLRTMLDGEGKRCGRCGRRRWRNSDGSFRFEHIIGAVIGFLIVFSARTVEAIFVVVIEVLKLVELLETVTI